MKKNLVLIGMPGCGKSTFGKILAQELKRPFYDADTVLEEREQKSIKDFFKISEDAFRQAETRTIAYLAAMEGTVIATGGGVVTREENIDLLRKNGVIIYINRRPENIITCIHDNHRPLLADDKLKIFNLYEQRRDLYKKYADYIIGNNGKPDEAIAKIVNYARREGLI